MMYGFLIILVLAAISAFFSLSGISLAASRRMKLRSIAEGGDARAARILSFQDQPGLFFTTVQIGLNAVAILAGIVGDSLLSPMIHGLLPDILGHALKGQVASAVPFVGVTLFFVLFADLIPKRIAMAVPEAVALRSIEGMRRVIFVLAPLSKIFNSLSSVICRAFGLPDKRRDDITSDDLYAMVEAGTMAGLLRKQEKDLIGNVFELDVRTVPSAMTVRENIVYLDLHEEEARVKEKIASAPHSTYIVCDKDIDHIVGYVDSKGLLERVVKGQSLQLDNGLDIRPPLIIPDTLTLAEAMDQFKGREENLAVVLNEYALVVGIITLQDIMMMLMGNLVGEEEQIIKRDETSWLIEGATPIEDAMHVFEIEDFPESQNYETIGGFLTFMLRRIPHRTDSVVYGGYKFEIMDIDNYKIDQILVTRLAPQEPKQEESPEVQEQIIP
ncbi:hemolysin family protein [uncultured Fretibacterium sp.]|uniref:hemolysin family protein n=1 Tax=uncultured Fretibacterium sp. TaxID=1678694 RepID=UPI0026054E87|nr:hemolysin family protein [uncultured Fretibacterium sp.]